MKQLALVICLALAACKSTEAQAPTPAQGAAAAQGGAATRDTAGSASATSSASGQGTSAAQGQGGQDPAVAAIVAAPDRADFDRALDAGRKPAETLAFLALKPGMKVAELGAGGGYTTELLARSVAPNGKVWAQNPPAFLKSFLKEMWPKRMERPAMKDVISAPRDFDDPLPLEAKDLDAVLINAIYHDTVYMKTDREKMNRAVFNALKPGGEYVVIDSSAPDGSGLRDVETLHRIDEKAVRDEVQKAGFKLAQVGTFLRNPDDKRDWNASPRAAAERRGTSDRFVLKFVKP